VSYFRLFI